jgi:hypothetical protein
MPSITKKFPWFSPLLLLLTYTNLGWVIYQAHYSLIIWLLLIVGILILSSSFTAPWSEISRFFRFLFQSNLRYFCITILGAFLLFLMLAKFRLFLDILVIIAGTMLVRLDFQAAGYKEKLAFGTILIFSLLGLGLGAILHLLFFKYLQ